MPSPSTPQRKKKAVMAAILRSCSSYFLAAGMFSFAINMLLLAPTLFMLQVSDRVLTTGNKETLVLLFLVYVLAISVQSALDYLRAKVLIRAGLRIDRRLSLRIMAILFERATRARIRDRSDAIRALDGFRQFITGAGVHALFDLPWMVIYLGILFIIHPMLGGVSVLFMVFQIMITVATEVLTNGRVMAAAEARNKSYTLAEAALRNAEVVLGMGMIRGILNPWMVNRRDMLNNHAVASDRNAALTALSRMLRLMVQSLLLGIGAYLAIERDITPGEMFAGMLLIGRATQPLDQILSLWRSMIGAREAYRNLDNVLGSPPPRETVTVLPKPTGRLVVERLVYTPQGSNRQLLSGVGFEIEPGTCLGVIGPTAAGKSTLARLIVGVFPPSDGTVRLDGADVFSWDRDDFGRYVGYLPQDVELFAGTVAQNIARFTETDSDNIIVAAQLAGAHDMILKLSHGYETSIGEDGSTLSGGQRQQVALARAVFGNPCFVVLDEPNANLDTEGDVSLTKCLANLKARNVTVVIVSHRLNVLQSVDKVLYMQQGQVRQMMTREELLKQMGATPGPGVQPVTQSNTPPSGASGQRMGVIGTAS
jgi:PrtD family type I secretion system ABC transporter